MCSYRYTGLLECQKIEKCGNNVNVMLYGMTLENKNRACAGKGILAAATDKVVRPLLHVRAADHYTIKNM